MTVTRGGRVLFCGKSGLKALVRPADAARVLGVNLIGTVSSEEKAALAIEHGAARVINYRRENFAQRGRGAAVATDGR